MPSPSLVLSPHSQNVTFLFTMMDWKNWLTQCRDLGTLGGEWLTMPGQEHSSNSPGCPSEGRLCWQELHKYRRNKMTRTCTISHAEKNRLSVPTLMKWGWRGCGHWECHPPECSLYCDDACTKRACQQRMAQQTHEERAIIPLIYHSWDTHRCFKCPGESLAGS